MKLNQRGGLALSHPCPFLPCLGCVSAACCGARALLCPGTPLSRYSSVPGTPKGRTLTRGSTCGDQACDWKVSCPSVSQRNCSRHLDLCELAAPALATCLPPSPSPHPVHLNGHSSKHDVSSSARVPKLTWYLPPTNLPARGFKFCSWYLLLPFGTFENLALKHILKLKFFSICFSHRISPSPGVL